MYRVLSFTEVSHAKVISRQGWWTLSASRQTVPIHSHSGKNRGQCHLNIGSGGPLTRVPSHKRDPLSSWLFKLYQIVLISRVSFIWKILIILGLRAKIQCCTILPNLTYQMGPLKYDYKKRLITSTTITLSSFHCNYMGSAMKCWNSTWQPGFRLNTWL